MYRKILVPLDGSDLADGILSHVQELARLHGAQIVLAHVLVSPVHDLLLTGPKLAHVSRQTAEQIRPEARLHLERAAERLGQAGLDVTTVIQEGLVADTILEIAVRHSTDLIVLSTHGHGGRSTSLLGSVAYRLVHEARLPVLLVPPESPT